MLRLSRLALLAWALGAASGVWAQSKPPADIDDYAARVLKTFEVPGVSVGIVKDGKLVFAKGYGVRAVEGNVDRADDPAKPRISRVARSSEVQFRRLRIRMGEK